MPKSLLLMSAALCLGAALLAAPKRPGRAEWGEPSPAEKKIAEALKSPTRLEFLEAPLQDVIDCIKDLHHIEIQLDQKALGDVGIPPDTPITRSLKGISLRSALRLTLRDLDLTYAICDEVLLITTPEEVGTLAYIRVYPVADLIGRHGVPGSEKRDCDSLIKAITTSVFPTSWDDVGGPGCISAIPPGTPKSLVVRQSHGVHEEIAEFLGLLRQVARMQTGGDMRPVGGSPITAAAEKKIAEQLRAPTELQFIEAPLQDVIDFLKKRHQIEIQIDPRTLGDVGIAWDARITKDLSGISLASALRLILRELDLTYVIQDEILLITTPEEAERRLVTKIYPLGDLVVGRREGSPSGKSYHDSLIKTITTMIGPATWSHVGGPGNIVPLSLGTLEAVVVRQTGDVHEQVEGLLSRPEFRQLSRPASRTVPQRRSKRFRRR